MISNSKKYFANTATLYSAALKDGDFHSLKDTIKTFLMGLITPFPEKMQINRAFGKHMYESFHADGFNNILDIGAGPMPRGHEWAPDTNILYVDHNPDITRHARKKLPVGPGANVAFETSSVRDLPSLWKKGIHNNVFGDDKKIAIGSNAVLMFVPDDEIKATFQYLYDQVDSGSSIMITTTAITSSESHFRAKGITRFFKFVNAPMYIRNIDNFVKLLGPWRLETGPMPAWQWLNWPPSKNTAGIGFDIYAMRLVKD